MLGLLTAPPRAAARAAAGAASGAGRLGLRLARHVATATDLGPQRHGRHVSVGGGRGLVEVRGLADPDGDGDRRALAEAVQAAVGSVRGVRWAQVNAVTGHLLLLVDDRSLDLSGLLDVVEDVEEDHGQADRGWSRGTPPHPADAEPLTAAVVALAADLAGLGAALLGRLLPLRPVPPAARALVGIVEGQPRLRRLAERALGQAGTDLAVGVGSGVLNGITDGIGPLLVTALSHAQLVAEVRSRRAVWQARADELCAAPAAVPEHPPVKAERVAPFPSGPVEAFADRVGAASAMAAAAVLALTGDVNRAAGLLLIGVPPAARLGREAFAATLARALAREQVVPMDPGAFRRLDRISAVVVGPAALGGDPDGGPTVVPVDGAAAPPTGTPGETTRETVCRLQAAGHGVLLVATGDDDALAAADVAVAVCRPDGTVGWTADLICGPEPAAVRILLDAVPVARSVSRRAVVVAGLGSAAAAVLTTLAPWPYSDLTMQPVYVSGVLTQLDAALAARRVAVRGATRAGSRGGRRTAAPAGRG